MKTVFDNYLENQARMTESEFCSADRPNRTSLNLKTCASGNCVPDSLLRQKRYNYTKKALKLKKLKSLDIIIDKMLPYFHVVRYSISEGQIIAKLQKHVM